jgi:hypothetical protein
MHVIEIQGSSFVLGVKEAVYTMSGALAPWSGTVKKMIFTAIFISNLDGRFEE